MSAGTVVWQTAKSSARVAGAEAVRFGYSYGPGADASPGAQVSALRAIRSVVGVGGYVRAPIHWDALVRSSPDWAVDDAFAGRVTQEGLRWIPVIYTSDGRRSLITPQESPGGLPAWSGAVRAVVARYGPGGTYSVAHPRFQPITSYELWNEPNTRIGNADPGCPTCKMNPSTADAIIEAGARAIRTQASAMGFRPEVIAFGIGTVDRPYLQRLIAADPNVLSGVDAVSVHLYMRQRPGSCPDAGLGAARCIRALVGLRRQLDLASRRARAPAIAITEGGYAGSASACRPLNVVSLSAQAKYGAEAIAWIQHRPSLRVTLYSPFQPIDAGSRPQHCGARWDPAFWRASLGAVLPNGRLSRGVWHTVRWCDGACREGSSCLKTEGCSDEYRRRLNHAQRFQRVMLAGRGA